MTPDGKAFKVRHALSRKAMILTARCLSVSSIGVGYKEGEGKAGITYEEDRLCAGSRKVRR
jgi:hypothetical protein